MPKYKHSLTLPLLKLGFSLVNSMFIKSLSKAVFVAICNIFYKNCTIMRLQIRMIFIIMLVSINI